VTHTLRFPTLPTTTTSGDCYYPPASLRHLCDQLVMPAGGGNNLHFLSLSRTLCVEEQPLEAKRLVEQLWTSSSLTWWPLRLRGFTFGDLHSRAAQPWSEVRVWHDSAAWPAARVTGTLVAHSTTIARPLNNINDMFNAIFKRKAFLSWFFHLLLHTLLIDVET
jgi:hypothetical protein